MGKRVILYLFLLFSLSLQAQTEEKVSLGNDSTEVDSTTTTKPSAFKRAIKKFMNFSDFDTLYISPNRYNYALMVTHFSNFEYYSITSELPQPQKLSFSPNPHNKIGLYFGWRWIFSGDVGPVLADRGQHLIKHPAFKSFRRGQFAVNDQAV